MAGGARQRQRDAENQLRDQTNLLPRKQLLVVYAVLACSLFTTFVDQNGVSTMLPSIARDFNAQATISWAGTANLIANTTTQVLYGRLSDLFGRKLVFMSTLGLLAFSDLMCGLSQNAPMFYAFRGLAGVAGGGTMALSMMIVSDIVSLERRGKYQGILGSAIGLGKPAAVPHNIETSLTEILLRQRCGTHAGSCLRREDDLAGSLLHANTIDRDVSGAQLVLITTNNAAKGFPPKREEDRLSGLHHVLFGVDLAPHSNIRRWVVL